MSINKQNINIEKFYNNTNIISCDIYNYNIYSVYEDYKAFIVGENYINVPIQITYNGTTYTNFRQITTTTKNDIYLLTNETDANGVSLNAGYLFNYTGGAINTDGIITNNLVLFNDNTVLFNFIAAAYNMGANDSTSKFYAISTTGDMYTNNDIHPNKTNYLSIYKLTSDVKWKSVSIQKGDDITLNEVVFLYAISTTNNIYSCCFSQDSMGNNPDGALFRAINNDKFIFSPIKYTIIVNTTTYTNINTPNKLIKFTHVAAGLIGMVALDINGNLYRFSYQYEMNPVIYIPHPNNLKFTNISNYGILAFAIDSNYDIYYLRTSGIGSIWRGNLGFNTNKCGLDSPNFNTLLKLNTVKTEIFFNKFINGITINNVADLKISNIVQTDDGIIGYSTITGKIYAWGTTLSQLNNCNGGSNTRLDQLVNNRFNSRVFIFGTRFNIMGTSKDDKGNDVITYDIRFTPDIVLDLSFSANAKYKNFVIIFKVDPPYGKLDFIISETITRIGNSSSVSNTAYLQNLLAKKINLVPTSPLKNIILIANIDLNTVSIISNSLNIMQYDANNTPYPFVDYRDNYLYKNYDKKKIDMYVITQSAPTIAPELALINDTTNITTINNIIGYAYLISTPSVVTTPRARFTNTEHFTESNNNIIYIIIILIIIVLIVLLKMKHYI